MRELFDGKENRKATLKMLIKRLHEGADPEEMKERFNEVLRDVTPTEIAQIEEELINEGMSREEIHRLCDIHLAVFRETLEGEKILAPPGHPIHILMEEHKILLNFADELKSLAKLMKRAGDFESVAGEMRKINRSVEYFNESESHYLREENVLFPYLERHGVTQPPKIMWMEHDRIRETEKNLHKHVDTRESLTFQEFVNQLEGGSLALFDLLSSHFYKENNVLFPTALRVMGEGEWRDIRKEFDGLGYCSFTPKSAKISREDVVVPTPKPEREGTIPFETDALSKEEIEAIFNTLPVDITFVDRGGVVRYFSQTKERIFVRTRAIIGRKVQQCHPQKSIHIVNKILEEFKSGSRDVAEFWINLKGRLIHIRYFPVRNKLGDYLGCLEATQDITDIKKIEGERRLLDWV